MLDPHCGNEQYNILYNNNKKLARIIVRSVMYTHTEDNISAQDKTSTAMGTAGHRVVHSRA